MSREQQFLHLRDLLLERRREVFARVRDMEARWQELSQPEIEIEEEAQRTVLALPYDRLDESGRDTIEQIDLALHKLSLGEYGICENCGDRIAPKRLEALPWARLCIHCAREFERKRFTLPSAVEMLETAELPDELRDLSNNQVLRVIYEQIEQDGRIDAEELYISIRNGVLHLDGAIGGEPEHQILAQILTDVLGFSSIVDRLVVSKVLFKREERTAGREPPPAARSIEDRLFYDEEELTEDIFEADEKPYSPPEHPPPLPEYRPPAG